MADRSYAAGIFAFGVDGEFAGYTKSVKGGVIKGEVVTHNLSTTNIQKKNLATISHETLTIEMAMGMGQAMWDWLQASMDMGFVQKNCELQACNFNHEVQAVRVFQDAYIKKFTIPACDGSSKDNGYCSIEIDPTIIRYEAGSGAKIQGAEEVASKKWLCSNFRFSLGDLPCDRVSKVDSLAWEQKVVKDEVGAFREPRKEPAAIVVPNIKLTITMADLKPWADWHKSFVIDGKCGDSDELTGSLEFLSPDLVDTLGTVEFSHVGIISLEQEGVEANKENIARFTVELYCEEMRFKPA